MAQNDLRPQSRLSRDFVPQYFNKCESIFGNPHTLFLPIVCSARYLSYRIYPAFVTGAFVDIAYPTPQYSKAPNITVSKKQLYYSLFYGCDLRAKGILFDFLFICKK